MNREPSTVNLFGGVCRPSSGFTLLELMTVIVIIAIVASITMASAQYLIRNARRQRAQITCRTLETALSRFRHEYKDWPGLPSVNEDVEAVVFRGTKNADVFGPLREGHSKNASKIRFLDESALLTASKFDGHTESLGASAAGAAKPLAYRAPKSGNARFFKVTINLDDDTAKVEMDDGDSSSITRIDRDDD